jgi:hypothetical protein
MGMSQVVHASTAWFWAMALGFSTLSDDQKMLLEASDADLTGPLIGDPRSPGDIEDADVSKGLFEHVKEARRLLGTGFGERCPLNGQRAFHQQLRILVWLSPGNVAWRSLKRFAGSSVISARAVESRSNIGHRISIPVFNRPESTLLLDSLYAADDGSYWEAVLSYCRDGNLQSVLDEYLHHLAEANGIEADTDDGIMALADAGRRALTIRAARYVGADVDNPHRDGIPFHSRFALRFGGIRQDQDDVRLPEVRAAFNSPFWPFVLASTSIGQEGVDFHWWCHAVVHWNLPSNPVDFEQREGRVSRYKGHAIRKNVAERYRSYSAA